MSDRAEMNENDSQFPRHLKKDYTKGWEAAKRLFLRKGGVDRESDNPFEENTEEWHGFVACCDYLWHSSVV